MGLVSQVAGCRPRQLPDSGTSILQGASQTDATYPPGVLCFLIDHTVTIKGGSCILGCSGPTEAGGLRSTPWVAEYAVFSGMISDLLNVIAFHLGVQKNILPDFFEILT